MTTFSVLSAGTLFSVVRSSGKVEYAQCTTVAPAAAGARSLSAITWALHAATEGFPLERHNVFFDDDYKSEFDDIFRRRRLPRQGTVYVCAQDRGGEARGARAPRGRERLLALVNAPAEGDRRSFADEETEACERRALALLADCGLRLAPKPRQVQRCTPADFERLFPGSGGALYGPATHGWMALFKRAASASRLPGLYLAGGSAHPGAGVPMAAQSGLLSAKALLSDLASTAPLAMTGTLGGTWMR